MYVYLFLSYDSLFFNFFRFVRLFEDKNLFFNIILYLHLTFGKHIYMLIYNL